MEEVLQPKCSLGKSLWNISSTTEPKILFKGERDNTDKKGVVAMFLFTDNPNAHFYYKCLLKPIIKI